MKEEGRDFGNMSVIGIQINICPGDGVLCCSVQGTSGEGVSECNGGTKGVREHVSYRDNSTYLGTIGIAHQQPLFDTHNIYSPHDDGLWQTVSAT